MFLKRIIITIYLILIFSFITFAKEKRLYDKFIVSNGNEIEFAFYLPENFSIEKTYPILIVPGNNDPHSESSYYTGENPSQFGWIVVEYSFLNFGSNNTSVKSLMEFLLNKYKVEGGKFHINGFSANSSFAYDLVMDLPNYFSSITCTPGHPRKKSTKDLKKLKDIKVQFIVGENDSYWKSESEDVYKKLKKLGITTNLEIIKNAGHHINEIIGKKFLEKINNMRK